MLFKKLLKRIYLQEKYSSECYIRYLRKQGVKIGEHTTFYSPKETKVDLQNPYMLEIGSYVHITSGVQLLTHDYSTSILSCVCGDIIGSVQPLIIGSHVFIGRNSIIMKGVIIHDRVIIGAQSLVTHDCQSDSVYAGVPAKRICSLTEMYHRWKIREKENAKTVAQQYYTRTGKLPDENILREYSMLFTPRIMPPPEQLKCLMESSGSFGSCMHYYQTTPSEFNGLTEFLRWCGLEGSHV